MKFLEKNINVLLGIFVLVFVIYGLTLWGDFVFDDRYIVDQYELLRNSDLKEIFLMPYWSAEAGLYRPITLLSYSLNYIFIGASPFGFHLINLILYGLVCFYIFKFLEKLFSNRNFALLTTFIFLILPIHTEVVANIIGRAEILALLFSILFLNELIREKINYWLLGLFLFLAIGSKETAVAVLPIALLIIYYKKMSKTTFEMPQSQKVVFDIFYQFLATISALIFYFSLRLVVLGSQHFLGVETSLVENPLLFASFFDRFATALSILTMYFGKIFIPLNLCSDYSYNQIPVLTNFWHFSSLLGLTIFISFLFSIFYFIKKQPIISLGSAIFIFSFLPISNLFFPIGTIAGERLMFYPSFGLAMIISFVSIKIYEHKKIENSLYKKIILIIFVCFSIFYIFIGITRSTDWLNEKKLFLSAGQCASRSVLSLSNMGTVYYFEGKYKEAEQEFLKSVKIYDGYSRGLNNLGLVYWKIGDHKKAKEFYLKALQTKFPYPGAYENLALLYLSQGDVQGAKRWLLVFFSGNKKTVDDYIRSYTK